MDRITDVKYPKWEVVQSAPDRVNIFCYIHDTRLCQIFGRMTIISTEQNYKACCDVKTGNTYITYTV